jgi:hypothetical protein
LVKAHESVIHHQALIRLTIPTAAECFVGEYSTAEKTMKHLDDLTRTAMSARFLIEYLVAVPPTGTQRLSLETYDELLSLCCEIAERGLHSDAIHFQLSSSTVSLLPSKRLGIARDDRYFQAVEFFEVLRASHATLEAADYFDRHWRDQTLQSGGPPPFLAELSLACVPEFGVSLTDMGAFLSAVEGIGDTLPGEAKVMKLQELASRLQESLSWDEGKVGAAIAEFSLQSRLDFLPPTNKADAYPWRYGRDLSYLRRPLLIRTPVGSEPEVIWGNRHLTQVGPYVLKLCLSGRLRARSSPMKKFVGRIRNEDPEAFNDQVAEFIDKTNPDMLVRARVKKVGRLRLQRVDGSDLGDVDVLVVDPIGFRIWVIETKDFDLARTPAELRHEIDKLTVGRHAAVRKHLERVAWVTEHASEVGAWLKVAGPPQAWRVESLLITTREILSRYLSDLPIRVMTFQELQDSGQVFAPIPGGGRGRRPKGAAHRTRRP